MKLYVEAKFVRLYGLGGYGKFASRQKRFEINLMRCSKLYFYIVVSPTVYNDNRLVYSLKDGTEIMVMF